MSSSKEECNHGDVVTLTCQVVSSESVQVTWSLPDESAPTAAHERELDFTADFKHNGEFACAATFPDGTTYSNSITQIVRGVSKLEETTFTSFVGNSLSLTCSFHGDVDDKDIVWTTPAGTVNNNVETVSNGKYHKTSTLTISELRQSHFGRYTCSLTFTEDLTFSLEQSIG